MVKTILTKLVGVFHRTAKPSAPVIPISAPAKSGHKWIDVRTITFKLYEVYSDPNGDWLGAVSNDTDSKFRAYAKDKSQIFTTRIQAEQFVVDNV